MIYSLRGTLVSTDPNTAVIECGGVGFGCNVSMYTLQHLPPVGQEAFVYTHLNVREDALDLYAFADREELQAFRMLTTISGVGAKMALAILSQLDPQRLVLAIASGDAKSIQAANGVGPKLAQRICLELKDKVGKADFSGSGTAPVSIPAASTNASDAIEVLVSLGYSQSDAVSVISKLDASLSVEEMIKLGLNQLAKKL